jgi:uncharacterized protein YbjT (DUF2867 family)
VTHHVALSVVGTGRLQENGYFQAKLAQERLIAASPIPYTILRSTQLFEFLPSIAAAGAVGQTVRISPALFQPIAAADVAATVASIAVSPPVNGISEVPGPDRVSMAELAQQYPAQNRRCAPGGGEERYALLRSRVER